MDHNDLLDHIVEVEATVARMLVLVEGALVLFDEAWLLLAPAKRDELRQALQCLDAIGLALGNLRELLRGMQEASLALSERLAP